MKTILALYRSLKLSRRPLRIECGGGTVFIERNPDGDGFRVEVQADGGRFMGSNWIATSEKFPAQDKTLGGNSVVVRVRDES